MLTARGTEADRIVGLELGADDYVVKPFSGGEVIARIRAILRRAQPAPGGGGAARAGHRRRARGRRRAPAARRLGGDELQLSRKEFDLLAELIRHAGRVVTREQLDRPRLGRELVRLDQDARRPRPLAAPEARRRPDRPRFLHTVRGVGFRFTAPEEFS